MILIGVAGHIGAGKDTIAAFLGERYGFTRRGFADALKQEVSDRLQRTLRAVIRTIEDAPGEDAWAWWDARIRRALWGDRHPIVRALLQEYGTEVRRTDDPDYWVKAWRRWASEWPNDARIVVPDVRFVNEAQMIRHRGCYLIRVERPGHAGDAHESEHGLKGWQDWNAVFQNMTTIQDLHDQVETWVGSAVDFNLFHAPYTWSA